MFISPNQNKYNTNAIFYFFMGKMFASERCYKTPQYFHYQYIQTISLRFSNRKKQTSYLVLTLLYSVHCFSVN